MGSPYREPAIIVHRDVKPANLIELVVIGWGNTSRRARRRWVVWRGGRFRTRFIRCIDCGKPLLLASDGMFSAGPRRQLGDAQHLWSCTGPAAVARREASLNARVLERLQRAARAAGVPQDVLAMVMKKLDAPRD